MAKSRTQQAADDLIISAQKGLAEASARFKQANAVRSSSDTLLNPDDIMTGKVDAGRLWKYMTSRGGVVRPLTMEDVLEFERKANQLGKRYEKGIKLQDVIDLSLRADIDRAAKEIRSGVPQTSKGGVLRFVTNAGPKSKVKRHYVTVQVLNFEAAVVGSAAPEKIVKQVIKGNCAISCDCERWRFWYAYMSTKGGYNANPNHRESAYPKIRNTELHGLACKHIIRVVQSLTASSALHGYIARLIKMERDKVETRLRRVSQEEMRKIQQEMQRESSRTRNIKTTDEKRAQRQAQPSYQKQQQQRAAAKKARAAMLAEAKERAKKAEPATVNASKLIANMMARFKISQAEAEQMIRDAT